MSVTEVYVMGITDSPVFPIAAVIIIIFTILILSRKSKSYQEKHFDEMQLSIRAAGYKIGYFVTLAGLLVLIILMDSVEGFSRQVAPSFGMFVVMMTGIVVFVIYCIFKEAFFSIGQNRRSYILLCLLILLVNGTGAVGQMKGRIYEDEGVFTFSNSANLVCSLSFLIILICLVIKSVMDRKEVAE